MTTRKSRLMRALAWRPWPGRAGRAARREAARRCARLQRCPDREAGS